MKDQAFLRTIKVKYEVNQFKEEVKQNQTANEKIQLKNRQNINSITHMLEGQYLAKLPSRLVHLFGN